MAASHLILGFHPYPLAGLRPNVRCKVPSGFRRPARGWHVAVACESHELNADNYYPADVLRLLRLTNGAAAAGFTRDGLLRGGNVPAERIAAYALLDVAPDGTLRRVIEKPDDASFARLAGRNASEHERLATHVGVLSSVPGRAAVAPRRAGAAARRAVRDRCIGHAFLGGAGRCGAARSVSPIGHPSRGGVVGRV